MNKRMFFGFLSALLFVKGASAAPKNSGSVTFYVPNGVKKIRVRSYQNGKKILDRSLPVEPGQSFTIDPQ